MKFSTSVIFGLVVLLSACSPDDGPGGTPQLKNFAYATSEAIDVEIQAFQFQTGASFSLYTQNPADGGELIGRGRIDEDGTFSTTLRIGIDRASIYLQSDYVGLPGGFVLPIVDGSVRFDYTRLQGAPATGKTTPQGQKVGSTVFSYHSPYSSNGKPLVLAAPDAIDASLLADINASLPERAPVPTQNPQYLAQGNDTDIKLDEACDVWITWIHEGAGYRNAIGFYTYDRNNPPSSPSDIDSIHVILPNASNLNSGGDLLPGDKVYLGAYPEGTAIGYVLFQDAWNGNNQSVNFGKTKYYSNVAFNPETAANRQHNVLLHHQQRGLIIIGFEDLDRDGSSDDDFNDAVFYVTANPIEAIDTDNLPPITDGGGNDCDNDGVDDSNDLYPCDPEKAFDHFYPFESGFASVAFEDLWPAEGDYDFNDLVMGMNYRFVTNARNEIVEIDMKFNVRHIGAAYLNGFAVGFPFPASSVESVTGAGNTGTVSSIASNGVENGHANAVLVAFDNAFDHEGDTLKIQMRLQNPYSLAALNSEGLDPFLFVNGNRGREVHLKGRQPSALADLSLFGTGNDTGIPGTTQTYQNAQGMPWAIEINHNYRPPVEKVRIEDAYLRFSDWAESNGANYKDWFSNSSGSYRNANNLQ